MATESMKSTKPGAAKSAGDKTQAIVVGGKGSKGVTNDQLKQLGRGMARAAANGKAY